MFASPQVEEREDEDPDEIDEVPVQARDLDNLVVAAAARKEASSSGLKVAAPNLAGNDDQEDHAECDVRAVEPRDHEEGRTELRRSPRVLPWPHSLLDELGPLEGLHTDKCSAEQSRHEHEDRCLLAVASIAVVDCHRHRTA